MNMCLFDEAFNDPTEILSDLLTERENWLMEEGEQRVREAYGEQRYERLQAVKRTCDPENVFRLNQNIQPA